MPKKAASARILIDTNRIIAEVSPMLFGGFAEHMRRCVYQGIYEPGSPHTEHQTGALFVVNRSLHETVDTELVWQDGALSSITNLYQMAGSDPKAANT
jgi:alpha-L-arabinofuranosidase